MFVNVVPPHHLCKLLLAHVGIYVVLSLRTSKLSVDLGSRFPAEIAGHFPVDKSYNPVIFDNAVGRREIIVHKAHILVKVCRKENVCLVRV